MTRAFMLLGLAMGCGSLEPTPIDAHLGLTRKLQAERMDRMCADWPGLGLDVLGHVPKLVMLAKGDVVTTTLPTPAQLAGVGLSAADYRAWSTDMVVVDIDLMRTNGAGVDMLMHIVPADAGTLEVFYHCGGALPDGAVAVPQADAHHGTEVGLWCAELEAGWWVCRATTA